MAVFPHTVKNPILRVLARWFVWLLVLIGVVLYFVIVLTPLLLSLLSDSPFVIILGIAGTTALFILSLIIVDEIDA